MFKKYNTIEDIINLDKYIFSEEYNKIQDIRNIFINFNYDKPNKLIKTNVNIDSLKNFLQEKNIKNKNIEIFN